MKKLFISLVSGARISFFQLVCKGIQWGQYVFDPIANYENWLLVEMGTEYKFTHLFM